MKKIMNKEWKLDFSKYEDRLEQVYPQYSEEELQKLFIERGEFWAMIIENFDKLTNN